MKRKALLNGASPSAAEAKQFASAVQDRAALVSRGGFLFKAGLDASHCLHLGVLPVIEGTQRNMHHTITLGTDPSIAASGLFNTRGEIELVLVPRSGATTFTGTMQAAARDLLTTFSSQLIAWGMSPEAPLAWVVSHMLKEAGMLDRRIGALGELADPSTFLPAVAPQTRA